MLIQEGSEALQFLRQSFCIVHAVHANYDRFVLVLGLELLDFSLNLRIIDCISKSLAVNPRDIFINVNSTVAVVDIVAFNFRPADELISHLSFECYSPDLTCENRMHQRSSPYTHRYGSQ